MSILSKHSELRLFLIYMTLATISMVLGILFLEVMASL